MLDGTYKIEVDVLFGRKDGSVSLKTDGDIVYIDIDAPVIGRQKIQGKVQGESFTAEGSKMVFLVGRIDYEIKGTVSGDNLHVEIKSNRADLELDGVRI